MGVVATKYLFCILSSRRANIASLGIEHQRQLWISLPNVGTQVFELTFGAFRREIRDLGLESTHKGSGGIDNLFAELKNRIGSAG